MANLTSSVEELQGEVKTKNRKTVSGILFPCQDFQEIKMHTGKV